MSTAIPNPEFIYKITTGEVFAASQAKGVLVGMPIDLADGFLHFSAAEQLPETLSLYFAGQSDLALIAVRTADVADNLKWEVSRGGALFPHLFAELPLSQVAWSASISVAGDGSCVLPEAVK
jgi:uncharacterized protein (DUF952 family)